MTLLNIAAAIALLSLTACASNTQSRVTTAATAPLNDLNLVRADFPEILEHAKQQPYLVPTDHSCSALTLEVGKLDEVLGADIDAPVTENKPSLLERGGDVGKDSAIDALQRTTEGLIPFRGWVRKLTGAERYAKHVSAAITAGSIRRAFLKGVGASQGCLLGSEQQAANAPALSQ
jgi:hypothetical protein